VNGVEGLEEQLVVEVVAKIQKWSNLKLKSEKITFNGFFTTGAVMEEIPVDFPKFPTDSATIGWRLLFTDGRT